MIRDDSTFIQWVSSTWGISPDIDIRPPPQEIKHRHYSNVKSPPHAKQSHGDLITWKQEKSRIEHEENSLNEGIKVIFKNINNIIKSIV